MTRVRKCAYDVFGGRTRWRFRSPTSAHFGSSTCIISRGVIADISIPPRANGSADIQGCGFIGAIGDVAAQAIDWD